MDELVRQLLSATQTQNALLQKLAATLTEGQILRNQQMQAWQKEHPQIVDACQTALPTLAKIQAKFLSELADELNDTGDDILDNQFSFNEFVDKFGQRLAHLNAMFQVVTQMSTPIPTQKA